MWRHICNCFILLVSIFTNYDAFSNEVLPLGVQIKLTESRDLNKRVFGVHGELLWSPLRYGSEVLVKEYNDLGFTNIRFPGGTTGNYYLWKTEKFGCNSKSDLGEKAKHRIKKFNEALGKKNRTYTIDDFLSFIKNTNTGFSLVVNVVCDTPENTRQLMEKIRDEGVKLQYVEMGNELEYKEHFWKFPEPVDYINQAKKHVVEVKSIFPDVKVALVASSASYKSKYFPDLDKASKNKKRRRGFSFDKLAASASFADAFAFHVYTPLGTTRYDQRIDKVEYDRTYRNIISYMDGRLTPSLQYFNKMAPEKEIWITEWGLSFYGWLRPHEDEFKKTFYSALYTMNGLLNFTLSPLVDSANFHNLTSLWSKSGRKKKANSTHSVMVFIKEAMQQYEKISHVSLTGSKSYVGIHPQYTESNLEINAAFYHNSDNGLLIIVNKLGASYKLDSLSVDNSLNIVPVEFMQIHPGKGNTPSVSEVVTNSKLLMAEDKIEIPPYSITKIRVNLKSAEILTEQ